MASDRHIPVLLRETLALLQVRRGTDAVDGTAGDGGHARAILEASGPAGRLLALDRDPRSLARAKDALAAFGDRAVFAELPASRMQEALARINPRLSVQAIVLDLGIARHHVTDATRGFSFQVDGPLDMRFDPRAGHSAAELIAAATPEQLNAIFSAYGEDRYARAIADAIVSERSAKPFLRTLALSNVVLDVYRRKLHSRKEIPWIGGRHPSTNVFQALRIAVNDEYSELEKALAASVDALAPSGRLAVISFHSGEDRIVKRFFRSHSQLDVVTKKPIIPARKEIDHNSSARSAKLRGAQKKEQIL